MALREGFGIARYRQNVLGDGFNQRNITVVMVGYRNLSILPIVRGIPQKGASSDLGMFLMVNNFVQDCGAGLSADDPKVVSVLVEAGASCDDIKHQSQPLRSDERYRLKQIPQSDRFLGVHQVLFHNLLLQK
ncbi:hypothetical protein NUACC26_100640 [Scytonema sp. NUACC26]